MSIIKLQDEMKRWKAITIGCLLWNLYITGTTFDELVQMLRARAKMHEDYGREIIDVAKGLRKLENKISETNKRIDIVVDKIQHN